MHVSQDSSLNLCVVSTDHLLAHIPESHSLLWAYGLLARGHTLDAVLISHSSTHAALALQCASLSTPSTLGELAAHLLRRVVEQVFVIDIPI